MFSNYCSFVKIVLVAISGASVVNSIYFPCTTPNNERAACISLFSCPVLINSVGSSDPSVIDFVKKSVCGDCRDGDIKVCCGMWGSYSAPTNVSIPAGATADVTTTTTTKPTQESQRDFVIRKLLPSRKYCGLQHTDDRFYNESETALDEFPWLVHVKWYNLGDEEDYSERCNGVLISSQYVLTDYLCGFHATKVKLGQYITGQNVTCIENPDFPECTEPIVEINVEEKFYWAVPQRSGSYNFVLMRLVKKVAYSDFIRPICLPIDESIRFLNQQSLIFSGWGAEGPPGVSKKRLAYSVTSSDTCYKASEYLEGNIKSAQVDLICLKVQANDTNLACNGDHGGPLMFSHNHQWFAQGILISVYDDRGSDYCSRERPVNGIAITPDLIEWILGSMHA